MCLAATVYKKKSQELTNRQHNFKNYKKTWLSKLSKKIYQWPEINQRTYVHIGITYGHRGQCCEGLRQGGNQMDVGNREKNYHIKEKAVLADTFLLDIR